MSTLTEAALDVLRGAGYPLPDYALHDSALEDPLRSCTITVSGLRTRHPWTPGLRWIILDETFVLPQEETVNDNLPLSPAISQWLDVQTDILQGKGGLGKAQRTLPYTKGTYPRFPALSSSRYLPVDAESLFTCPRAPPSWYQVCST